MCINLYEFYICTSLFVYNIVCHKKHAADENIKGEKNKKKM